MASFKDWNPAALLADELMAEKASALGRLGRAVEQALADLAAFDAATAAEAREDARDKRRALVDAAAYAVWLLMVQRESCGLRDSRALVRDYKVPADVVARVGIATKPPTPPGRAARRRDLFR